MTGLLVSVRSAAEARAALAGGANLIDVKEPRRGSLGAASPTVWREVAEAVAGAVPLSAALGELRERDFSTFVSFDARYQFAKLGLAGCARLHDWEQRWAWTCAALPASVTRVAVVYADWRTCDAPEPDEILAAGTALGCGALLVDTFDKSAGDLFCHLPEAALNRLLTAARRAGLKVVLAGSLAAESLSRALALSPDFVAVRGAVCRSTRTGSVEEHLVRNLVEGIYRPTSRFKSSLSSEPGWLAAEPRRRPSID